MKVIFTFIYLFILTSFITRTVGKAGIGIMGRLVIADIFAVISLLIFIMSMLISGVTARFPTILKAFFFLMLTFLVGIVSSRNITATLLEILILFFLSLIFIVLISTHKTKDNFLRLVFITSIASLLASFTGIWDLLSVLIGLPRIFPRDEDLMNIAVGGFRNTGQAGAYLLIMIAINISVISSPLYQMYSIRQRLLFKLSLVLSVVFLFLTVKIAAYIGLIIGIFLFSLKKRNMGVVYGGVVFMSILFLLHNNLGAIAPDLKKWMIYKTETKMQNGTAQGFISHNLSNAIKAFEDNPFLGSGIGGFAGVYERHEVHSTYFKILGETGFFGLLGYSVFMTVLLKIFFIKNNNPYANFLSNMQPFFVGFMISWGYTYHLRKREFWIMVAIIYLASSLSKNYNKDIK